MCSHLLETKGLLLPQIKTFCQLLLIFMLFQTCMTFNLWKSIKDILKDWVYPQTESHWLDGQHALFISICIVRKKNRIGTTWESRKANKILFIYVQWNQTLEIHCPGHKMAICKHSSVFWGLVVPLSVNKFDFVMWINKH